MTYPVRCKLDMMDAEELGRTLAFLRKAFGCTFGIEHTEAKDYPELTIELRDAPEVMKSIKGRIVRRLWPVSQLCADGISFYLADVNLSDGFVFIPMTNVIAIHTLHEDWLTPPGSPLE